MLTPDQTVASVVISHSECAEVFHRHRIDFCCGGEVSLEAAAHAKRLEVDALLDDLSRAIAERGGDPATDWREVPTPQLISHIVAKHHGYLRHALPFVGGLAAKVGRVHGDRNSKLRDLQATVEELAATLTLHLDDEEKTLFPALSTEPIDRKVIASQLAAMVEEHLYVAKLLGEVRSATDDFAVPEWACRSYQALFSELQQLEKDVMTHVHLENHILKPRFAH